MADYFICDTEAIGNKLHGLVKTWISDDGWTIHYRDETSNVEWVLARYDAAYHGGGNAILKRLPLPSIGGLIEIALNSNNLDDVAGASIELKEREEHYQEEYREALIEKMLLIDLEMLSEFEKERLRTIICKSNLHHSINRRPIVGKHLNEIKTDAEFYQSVAHRAQMILEKTKDR